MYRHRALVVDEAQVLVGLLRKVGGVLRIAERLLACLGADCLPLLLCLLCGLQCLQPRMKLLNYFAI